MAPPSRFPCPSWDLCGLAHVTRSILNANRSSCSCATPFLSLTGYSLCATNWKRHGFNTLKIPLRVQLQDLLLFLRHNATSAGSVVIISPLAAFGPLFCIRPTYLFTVSDSDSLSEIGWVPPDNAASHSPLYPQKSTLLAIPGIASPSICMRVRGPSASYCSPGRPMHVEETKRQHLSGQLP
ncbi:hypothetical protein C8R47DRAFT_493787 [Mycena vitilis]|nr:hypothetical protein C8R47DRAFT_493787 [Mycena vitilis]